MESISFPWHDLVYNIVQAGLELFLYGIYVHLFFSAIHVLSRRGATGRNVLLLASWAMFLAGATQMIIQLLSLAFYVQALQSLYEPGSTNGADHLAAYNSFVTVLPRHLRLTIDFGKVYRCYVIWGRNKAVVVLPVMLVLCTAALAVAIQYSLDSVTATQVGFLSIAITNFVLTGLTAGRIWWLKRQSSHPKNPLGKRYNNAIAIIIESGALYFVFGILLAATARIEPQIDSLPFGIFLGIGKQGVNIIPALSIILGVRHVDGAHDSGSEKYSLTVGNKEIGSNSSV
ncbi:hypothetical protein FB45DRAFT_531395 [Roridomyces roridus]|uniref:Uncharacterized protein n=1 Tax=Roridomyces roridus TaxID=1738132 RepID=A0AAD7BT35_9AGAR|nr:hypothetical protein FB45DRAFT_531395 [Roridomyces roridus]